MNASRSGDTQPKAVLPEAIAREMGIDAAEIARRKAFLEFTDEDVALLVELHEKLKVAEKAFVDDFYARLLQFAETRALIPDDATRKRLKRTQAAYFESLTAGEYAWPYVLDRLKVGLAHERVGLAPQWYIGAYNKYLGSLLPLVFQVMGGMDKAIAAFRALMKIVLFDMELALDTYFYADRRELAQIKAALDEVLDVVFLCRPEDLAIVYANRGAEFMLGYRAADLRAMRPPELMHGFDTASFAAIVERLIRGGEPFVRMDVRLAKKDGGEVPAELILQYVEASAGAGLVIGIARDISEYIRHQQELEYLAMHDLMTGLPNRRLLRQEIQTRMQDGAACTLIFLGLNRLKAVNEALGFAVGDQVLRKVAERLGRVECEGCLLARFAGDVFTLLAPCAGADEALALARDCRESLAGALQLAECSLEVQASMGIALYPLHGAADADELLRQAGVAMEAAKRRHTEMACYDPELEEYRQEHLNLAAELRRAIDHGELTLYYQPKVDMRTGRTVAVEALVRWVHPELGFMPPDRFIPLAEESALIHALTAWVIRAACAQRRRWMGSGLPEDFHIAVNITAANLENAAFVGMVRECGSASGIAPGMLTLEITESGLMHDPECAHTALARLHEIGVGLAIDDFGTGYSSLAYLKDMPVRELKIDRSFVCNMLQDEKSAAIVRAVIQLAHNLDLKVVAEGVEDKAMWDHLAKLGCDLAQGYYMGRPMPAAELERWLAASPYGMISS